MELVFLRGFGDEVDQFVVGGLICCNGGPVEGVVFDLVDVRGVEDVRF